MILISHIFPHGNDVTFSYDKVFLTSCLSSSPLYTKLKCCLTLPDVRNTDENESRVFFPPEIFPSHRWELLMVFQVSGHIQNVAFLVRDRHSEAKWSRLFLALVLSAFPILIIYFTWKDMFRVSFKIGWTTSLSAPPSAKQRTMTFSFLTSSSCSSCFSSYSTSLTTSLLFFPSDIGFSWLATVRDLSIFWILF